MRWGKHIYPCPRPIAILLRSLSTDVPLSCSFFWYCWISFPMTKKLSTWFFIYWRCRFNCLCPLTFLWAVAFRRTAECRFLWHLFDFTMMCSRQGYSIRHVVYWSIKISFIHDMSFGLETILTEIAVSLMSFTLPHVVFSEGPHVVWVLSSVSCIKRHVMFIFITWRCLLSRWLIFYVVLYDYFFK